jgi:tetratricopeptide (TPR) repeat protein
LIRKAAIGLIILFCISSIIFAEVTPKFDITRYDNLYKEGRYETIIQELSKLFKNYTDWIGPQVTEDVQIHTRNLLADSYRGIGKYTQASKWYAMTIEGFEDPYAIYCFEVMYRSATIIGIKSKYRQSVPFLHYDGRLGSNPSHEKTLIRILTKLTDDTSLVQKQQYFRDMASFDKNNDWVTQLTKYCSGGITLEELWPSISKENIGTVSTYAGLSLEISGKVLEAQELYRKALLQEKSDNIESLLAANRMGLFALKMIYSTIVNSNKYTYISLTDVYSVRVSSAKQEDGRLYSIQNLLDGDLKTAWVPDSKTSGIGEWAELSFDGPVQINSLTLTNGYAKNDVTFKNNNRINNATLIFSDGSKQQISLKDTMEPQKINVNKKSRTVRLIIDAVYKGIKYDDTCLSGMDVDFKAQ